MKKGLLGGTALIGAAALTAGAAGAAEAPTWKLTGNANFQVYYVDQDFDVYSDGAGSTIILTGPTGPFTIPLGVGHGWYFGVDESELQLNVSGTADNGLNYGFKVEINANTDDNTVADEVRLQLSGGWGTLQMGDEDGAEDVMNYGGENLMGAAGGFDGDFDDVLIRDSGVGTGTGAVSYPTIAGDTSDRTKISYFSPRFSGFQAGASLTPVVETRAGGPGGDEGDEFKADGDFENAIGLGVNYDNSFGGVRVRASGVYSMSSSNISAIEDVSAWSLGGIVGFGPISIGANYTDNGDSARGAGIESSYWNAAASFETGTIYLSAGYMASSLEGTGWEDTFSTISLTADYTVAPGLTVYGELDMISDEYDFAPTVTNDATIFIAGANVSF